MQTFEDYLYADLMSYHNGEDGKASTPEAIGKRVAIDMLTDAEIVHNNLVEANLAVVHTATTHMLISNATALNGLRRAVMNDEKSVIMELEGMAASRKNSGYRNHEQNSRDTYDFAIELFAFSDLAK